MKNGYKIVGFERISPRFLTPHPDAELPMDTEDAMALGVSMGERGLIQPLIVTAKPDKVDGFYQILDGVNRWKSVVNGKDPDQELPCILAECDNPRELALVCLSTGRKRTTGQRVMAFLEMHRREVLKVAEIVGNGLIQNRKGRSVGHVTDGQIPNNLAHFTAEAIAATLGVSDKDVRLGIEILQCIEKRLKHGWSRGALEIPQRDLDLNDEEDRRYYESLKAIHGRLLAGSTPVRRWKAAAGGQAATVGREVEINYAEIADRSMISLINAFGHWKEIKPGDRQILADKWERVAEAARIKANL